jgi:hypothetical protein
VQACRAVNITGMLWRSGGTDCFYSGRGSARSELEEDGVRDVGFGAGHGCPGDSERRGCSEDAVGEEEKRHGREEAGFLWDPMTVAAITLVEGRLWCWRS